MDEQTLGGQVAPRVTLREFRERIGNEMVPLSSQFSYFSASTPFSEEDIRDYLEDPIAALPPAVCLLLPRVNVLLVPYLERLNGKAAKNASTRPGRNSEQPRGSPRAAGQGAAVEEKQGEEELVVFERPAEPRILRSARWAEPEQAVVAFALEEMEVAEYHYELYRQLAAMVQDNTTADVTQEYTGILREELNSRIHGEVDDASWQRKQALLRRDSKVRRDSKAFLDYARYSFVDTLTLYLHGICCDIDVETGPRQIPSRHLKRRLRLLHSMFPPPSGYAVFPEELEQSG